MKVLGSLGSLGLGLILIMTQPKKTPRNTLKYPTTQKQHPVLLLHYGPHLGPLCPCCYLFVLAFDNFAFASDVVRGIICKHARRWQQAPPQTVG